MQASLRRVHGSRQALTPKHLGAACVAVVGTCIALFSGGFLQAVGAVVAGAGVLGLGYRFLGDPAHAPRFDGGVLLVGGLQIDPFEFTAVAMTPTGEGGVVHIWCDELEYLVTSDTTLFAVIAAAVPPTVSAAPRTYHASGVPRTAATLVVAEAGLSFPAAWLRGQGFTEMQHIGWPELQRAYFASGFLLLERVAAEPLNTGLTVAPDLEATVLREIEERRQPSEHSFSREVLDALQQLDGASAAADASPGPFRQASAPSDAPTLDSEELLRALAHGPVELRLLAADELTRRGLLPEGARAFVVRGLQSTSSETA